MSFIKTIEENEAPPELAAIYERISGSRGGVANVMKVHSLNPAAMLTHFEMYKAIMFGKSGLRRPFREMIGTLVSSLNNCAYCVAHHSEPLVSYKIETSVIDALRNGSVPDELPAHERMMLLYAMQVTKQPAVEHGRIAQLREHGWTDKDILDATLIVSYFNFVNRIVLSLGAELEDGFEATCKTTA